MIIPLLCLCLILFNVLPSDLFIFFELGKGLVDVFRGSLCCHGYIYCIFLLLNQICKFSFIFFWFFFLIASNANELSSLSGPSSVSCVQGCFVYILRVEAGIGLRYLPGFLDGFISAKQTAFSMCMNVC